MAHWEGVLDTQLEVHNWLTGKNGKAFGAGYFESTINNPSGDDIGTTDAEEARRKGAAWADRTGVAVFNAEPIYVDPDMMTVAERAVEGFVPEPLTYTDLITPMGFLVLPRSLWLTDPQGQRLSWRAALWQPVVNHGLERVSAADFEMDGARGIHLVLFHDVNEPDDIDDTDREAFNDYIKRHGNRWTASLIPTHVVVWNFNEMHPVGGDGQFKVVQDAPFSDQPQQPMSVELHTATDKETGALLAPDALVIQPSDAFRSTTAHKQLQGMWRLLTQYLAVPSRQRPPRQAWKRAKAAKLPHEHVTIVRLRRPPQEKQPGEPSTVNWQQRWVVGGHWRNQWYSSLGIHRQIWISPFVKGPADMPLIVNKARIFELVR